MCASYTSGNMGQVLITNFFCFAYDHVGNTEITERLVMFVQGIPSIKQLKFIVSQPRW